MARRTLDRYLSSQIYGAVVFVLVGFLGLFAFFDLIRELGDLGKGNYNLREVFAFVLLSVPANAYELFPVVVLIGTLYVLAHLASNSEYTVMRGAGLSPLQAAWTLARIGVVFVAATFVIGEWIAPLAEETAQKVRLRALSGIIGQDLRSGLWFKDERSFINVREARQADVLMGVRIYEFDNAYRLRVISAAERGEYRGAGLWTLKGVVQTTFTVDGPRTASLAETEWRSAVNPDLLDVLLVAPDRMSTWKADSELSSFNRHASTEPFPLSPETLTVLRLAREVSLATAGAFDVTVGPLVDAWGFGPGPDPAAVPSAETIAALREQVGFEQLALDEAAGVAVKALPGLEVDLSAIAPGYAADLIAERLRAAGFARHLIEVGGELRVAGRNPDGTLWRIAIERPQAERRETQRVLELTDVAVATSGDYRDFYELDGVRYSHTIDPATGSPVRHSLVSATVLHESCALADAWATAMMVLGPEEGLRVAEANDLPVLLMVYEDDGLLELESAALARRLGGERTATER